MDDFVRRISRLWSIGGLLLIAATWPLWWVPSAADSYPCVPLLQNFRGDILGVKSSAILSGLSLAIVVCLLFVSLHSRSAKSIAWLWGTVGFALLVSFALDQHRMQPWAYQLAVYSVLFATGTHSSSRAFVKKAMLVLMVSVYAYSSLGKFDFQFTHTVGQQFLDQLSNVFQVDVEDWPLLVKHSAKIALVFPATELALAVGLACKKTRRYAGVLLMVMHASLIGLLGPWALNQSLGVLVWNGVLLVQIYLLAVERDEIEPQSESEQAGSRIGGTLRGIAVLVIGVVVVMPICERHGYWDHWLSWSLYSPHTSRTNIEFHRSVTQQLPQSAIPFLEPLSDGGTWQSLDLGGWSLSERLVPVYPQARYQTQLAFDLAQAARTEDGVRVIEKGVSDRWSGRRIEKRLIGRSEIGANLGVSESPF